ncbi:hypothetical protein Hanom_Chr13g01209231 [Helianthus anomalus]
MERPNTPAYRRSKTPCSKRVHRFFPPVKPTIYSTTSIVEPCPMSGGMVNLHKVQLPATTSMDGKTVLANEEDYRWWSSTVLEAAVNSRP